MSASQHTKATPRTDAGLHAGQCTDPVGGVCDHINGWWRGGLCHIRPSRCADADPVGAGSSVAERGGATLSSGVDVNTHSHPYHPTPGRRCSLGDGGRTTLHITGGCNRRGLGRTAHSGFHRNTAAGHKGRGKQSALLVGAPGGNARSECCAKPLADCITAIFGTPLRSTSPRQSTLAGGVVPITAGANRHMGGNL